MKPAMLEIEDKLRSTGMDDIEIEQLMSRFLEEEAELYVECIKAVTDIPEKNTVVH